MTPILEAYVLYSIIRRRRFDRCVKLAAKVVVRKHTDERDRFFAIVAGGNLALPGDVVRVALDLGDATWK